MTKEEAIALYRSGEEPTVKKLLELDAKVEELEKKLPKDDPSVPSGMGVGLILRIRFREM